MAELLVRVVDKINDDFYMNCGCTKRGDVIAVHENGAPWGVDELTLPIWAIVKLPNVSVSAASALLAPEPATDPLHPSKTLQRRAFKLDVDHPDIAALVAADTRTIPDPNEVVAVRGGAASGVMTVDTPAIDDVSLATFQLARPPIQDPAVIGDSPIVIG